MKLAICSAVYYCEEYINTNSDLIDLNGLFVDWFVVQNTPVKNSHLGDHLLYNIFQLLDKVQVTNRPIECTSDAQMQHGLSLNRCLKEVSPDTDFVLLLDPDFYIFQPIIDVIEYMDKNNIHIFGAPYLSATPLIENFPVGFCMFLDLRSIKKESLDFTPGYGNYFDKAYYPDVGYKVYYEHLFEKRTKYEIVIPSGAKDDKHPLRLVTDKTMSSVYNINYNNPQNKKGTKIDEYWWKDQLFALHLRTKLHQGLDKERFDRHMMTIKEVHAKYEDHISN